MHTETGITGTLKIIIITNDSYHPLEQSVGSSAIQHPYKCDGGIQNFCKVDLPSLCMESSESRHCLDASPSLQNLHEKIQISQSLSCMLYCMLYTWRFQQSHGLEELYIRSKHVCDAGNYLRMFAQISKVLMVHTHSVQLPDG